jgi:hypothetical protein
MRGYTLHALCPCFPVKKKKGKKKGDKDYERTIQYCR